MHFRYRLYTEAVFGIAQLDESPVHQTDTDTEQVLIYIGQIRDVIGIFTVCVRLKHLVGFLGRFLDL